MKKLSFTVLFITVCVMLSAQTGEEMLKRAISTNPTNSWGNARQKGQWTNGANMGAYLYPDGSMYVGNFLGNNRNGYGIYIAPAGYQVPNCPSARYHVGIWLNNVKNGTGSCYDTSGKLIYNGDFRNDKPTGTYPMTGYASYKFQTIDFNGDKYIGETKDGKRNGYGVFVWKDGNIWIGQWENGERSGQGIFIASNGSITAGQWNNNTHSPVPTVRPVVPSQSQSTAPDNMVRINGGTFIMGSSANEIERSDREGPQNQVTVSSFYMGKYEVTQKEYREVMGTSPGFFRGYNLPVETVTWYNAIEYCNKRSQMEGLTPAYTIDRRRSDQNNTNKDDNLKWVVTWNRKANGYRLPTEAEWEYACRAGTITPFSTGYNITTSQANYNGEEPYNKNDKGEYRKKTIPVGSFAPNAWGLYDMNGNVHEWCWDWYFRYIRGTVTDPVGASTGQARVIRGGSWSYSGQGLRSAFRSFNYPYLGFNDIGFRVVRSSL